MEKKNCLINFRYNAHIQRLFPEVIKLVKSLRVERNRASEPRTIMGVLEFTDVTKKTHNSLCTKLAEIFRVFKKSSQMDINIDNPWYSAYDFDSRICAIWGAPIILQKADRLAECLDGKLADLCMPTEKVSSKEVSAMDEFVLKLRNIKKI